MHCQKLNLYIVEKNSTLVTIIMDKGGREKGEEGGGSGWPELHQHVWVAQGQGLVWATAREWRCLGLSSGQKRAPRRRQATRRHQETGRNRSGWGGITTEEDRRPGTGGTATLRTGRDWASGRGRQGGGVVRGMAEEGWNKEEWTYRGWQGCQQRRGQR